MMPFVSFKAPLQIAVASYPCHFNKSGDKILMLVVDLCD